MTINHLNYATKINKDKIQTKKTPKNDKIQINNLLKCDKIQTNNTLENDKIQTNNMPAREINAFFSIISLLF